MDNMIVYLVVEEYDNKVVDAFCDEESAKNFIKEQGDEFMRIKELPVKGVSKRQDNEE